MKNTKKTILVFLFSLVLTSVISIIAKQTSQCYYCNGADCVEQTGGSGWTVCLNGNVYCALGGESCIVAQ